jgi:hypothetical protein
MGTKDVRIDTRLNKAIWAQGVRGTPFRHFYASGIKLKTVEGSDPNIGEKTSKRGFLFYFRLLYRRIYFIRKWRCETQNCR